MMNAACIVFAVLVTYGVIYGVMGDPRGHV